MYIVVLEVVFYEEYQNTYVVSCQSLSFTRCGWVYCYKKLLDQLPQIGDDSAEEGSAEFEVTYYWVEKSGFLGPVLRKSCVACQRLVT